MRADRLTQDVADCFSEHAQQYERIKRLETKLRLIQLHAARILEADNRPGYELREFAEEVHAMAASALSSGEPIKNEAALPGSCAHCGGFHSTAACPPPGLCSDCPPANYPTDKTRCADCPRANVR